VHFHRNFAVVTILLTLLLGVYSSARAEGKVSTSKPDFTKVDSHRSDPEDHSLMFDYFECLKIVDLLVDVPSELLRNSPLRPNHDVLFRSATRDLGGSAKYKDWIEKGVVEPMIWTSNAQSIGRLGNVDQFLPIYFTADQTRTVCKTKGCQLTVFVNRAANSFFIEEDVVFEKLDIKLNIGRSSSIQMSMKAPWSGEGQAPNSSFFFLPSVYRHLRFDGKTDVLDVWKGNSRFICNIPYMVENFREPCSALKKVYDTYFHGNRNLDQEAIWDVPALPAYEFYTYHKDNTEKKSSRVNQQKKCSAR
jgi:hypothetical protein